MASHQGDGAFSAATLGDAVEHAQLPMQVERTGGLVEQQQLRLTDQRLRQAKQLPLPAGQAIHTLQGQMLDAQALQDGFHPRSQLVRYELWTTRPRRRQQAFVGQQRHRLRQLLRQVGHLRLLTPRRHAAQRCIPQPRHALARL